MKDSILDFFGKAALVFTLSFGTFWCLNSWLLKSEPFLSLEKTKTKNEKAYLVKNKKLDLSKFDKKEAIEINKNHYEKPVERTSDPYLNQDGDMIIGKIIKKTSENGEEFFSAPVEVNEATEVSDWEILENEKEEHGQFAERIENKLNFRKFGFKSLSEMKASIRDQFSIPHDLHVELQEKSQNGKEGVDIILSNKKL